MIILYVVEIIFNLDISVVIEAIQSNEIIIPFLVLLIVINFASFSKENQDSVIEIFSKKPIEQRIRGAKITIVYCIGSIVFLMTFGVLRG